MNFIIFDLEATCWEGSPPSKVQEIIEIGAVLMNGYGEVEDEFSRMVRPILNPRLSAYCQELTNIKQTEVDRASLFPTVVELFQDWGLMLEEDYVLCSWGGTDKRLLLQDCQLHDIEDDWVHSHINIKHQYMELKRLRRPRGLKASVEAEGFDFTGPQHRALADAQNLAKIFVKYLDVWQF